MPKKKKPAYLLHKPTGQARVRIDGKDHYLGAYGSKESYEHYEALVSEWFAKQGDVSGYRLTIDDLALLYLNHAKQHYRKNGRPTSELSCIRTALRYVVRFFGRSRARDFGPKKLKRVCQAMVEDGHYRTSINKHMGRIRRMFKWAVAEELVPGTMLPALQAVQGLQQGRCDAVESDPVEPVPQGILDATLQHVPRPVAAMVRLQVLTGMRPGEVLIMRGCDITMTGEVWAYHPQSHKTEHHRKQRVIFLGPRAQKIVREYLKPELQAYLFSPRDAVAEHNAQRRENRKTPITPSQRKRTRVQNARRRPGLKYNRDAYRNAVQRACEKAFGMPEHLRKPPNHLAEVPEDQRDATLEQWKEEAREWRRQHCWHPHQLRHNAATEIRKEFGIEAARTVLGHSSAVTTEIYAEMDLEKAREIIGRVG